MAKTRDNTESIDDELLPSEYDQLVPAEQLSPGRYNPRRVRPRDELRDSIAKSGMQQALIVRPASDNEGYQITDGWQRYQAATDCGWEMLPVRIFESPLEALEAAESASIVREWTPYAWAQHCRAVAAESESESRQELIEQVADRTTKSAATVRRYLDVLSLPEEVHPLLVDGPEGSEQTWVALKNYNNDVRRYDGLQWTVAHQLARSQSELKEQRVIGIAAKAVEFERAEDAIEFVELAAEEPEKPLDTIRREVLLGQQHPRYIEVPRTVVQMERSEKQALMKYCREQRQSLTGLVTETVKTVAADVEDG
jgi:ParB/RepB/Spo0J family partition protein